jgi:pimeloyl-ACP methyl ester carboxylesterase
VPTHPITLYSTEEGSGPALILGHGFGGSARNFRPQSRALRDRYRVVLHDARGHARSDAPDAAAQYAPECFVADIASLLDDAGAATAVVGGLSMGASVALQFALAHPDRVRGLVLASFPAASGGGGFARSARAFADCIDGEGLEAAGERFVWGADSGLEERGAALVRQGFLEHPPHALAHILREFLAEQPAVEALAPALRTLRIPTLIVAGERDTASLGPSEALAAALPDAEFARIPDAGHVVNLARPAEFNHQLDSFLARLSAHG